MKKLLTFLIIVVTIFPLGVHAVSLPLGLTFGGYVTGATFCTCPPFGIAIAYKPLFLNSPRPIVGDLYYNPLAAIIFAFFLPAVPTTWELGGFIPGGICNVLNPANAAAGNPDPCAPPLVIPTLGSVRYMGTSLPGALPH